jgi:hypothetical protein
MRVCVTHKPTLLSVEIDSGTLFLSKSQWKAKRDELKMSAVRRLEEAVAFAGRNRRRTAERN